MWVDSQKATHAANESNFFSRLGLISAVSASRKRVMKLIRFNKNACLSSFKCFTFCVRGSFSPTGSLLSS